MILPNQLTVLRIILTPVFMFFFLSTSQTYKEISLVIFLVAALTDWYDGWLARKFNYFTSWGKFWDPMADKILTSGAFVCFIYLGVLGWYFVVLIVLRDIIVTSFRGISDRHGLSFPTSRLAKWKTAVQMIYLYYLLFIYVLSDSLFLPQYIRGFAKAYLLEPRVILYGLITVTVLTVYSGITYFLDNRKILNKLFGK